MSDEKKSVRADDPDFDYVSGMVGDGHLSVRTDEILVQTVDGDHTAEALRTLRVGLEKLRLTGEDDGIFEDRDEDILDDRDVEGMARSLNDVTRALGREDDAETLFEVFRIRCSRAGIDVPTRDHIGIPLIKRLVELNEWALALYCAEVAKEREGHGLRAEIQAVGDVRFLRADVVDDWVTRQHYFGKHMTDERRKDLDNRMYGLQIWCLVLSDQQGVVEREIFQWRAVGRREKRSWKFRHIGNERWFVGPCHPNDDTPAMRRLLEIFGLEMPPVPVPPIPKGPLFNFDEKPEHPVKGDRFRDVGSDTVMVYDGTGWAPEDKVSKEG